MTRKLIYKNLEQRIKEQEKETILNSLIEHVIYQDTKMRIQWANRAACESANMTLEEIIGRYCYEVWPLRSTPCPDCPVMQAMETGQPQRTEKSTADERSWFIRGYPVKDEEGNIVGGIEVTMEITEHKKAEEALRESEEKYRNLSEGTFEAVVWHDKGKIIEANQQYYEMFGYKPEELAGKDAIVLTATPNSVKFMREQISSGHLGPYEVTGLKKDGTEFPMEIRVKVMKTKGIMARMAAIRDLTDRRQAEEALRESENLYRNLAENSLVGFWHINLEGYTIYINPAMISMLEIDNPEELADKTTYHSFFTPESLEIIKNERVKRAEGIGSSYEVEIIGKRGRRRNAIISGSPLLSTDGKLLSMIATFTDITERRQAEEALKKLHEELELRIEQRTRELEIKTKSLKEVNTALEVLLIKREEDKTEIENNVLTNVNKLIAPYLKKIRRTELDEEQKALASIIESNINEIISPFTRRMSLKYLSLTPTEIQIANLIKIGHPTKKIAKILNISPRTVDTHRKNIRTKIGLDKKRANLRSHLLTLQ